MNKSTINLISKILKIGTWLGIGVACFFMFVSFRTGDVEDGKLYTYKSLIALAVGYLCNYIVKRLPSTEPLDNE